MLCALQYLHADGKLHRDIKSANVLVHESGQVKLADFGVAGQLNAAAKRDSAFVGTPYWMSPEVVKQSGYDGRADIWSVGILAYELAMGDPPYAELHPMKVLHLIPRNPPPELPLQFSSDLRDFVRQCLTRDPLRRPTAAKMLCHRFIRNAGSSARLKELVASRRLLPDKVQSHTRAPPKSVTDAPLWEFASLRNAPPPVAPTSELGAASHTSAASSNSNTTAVLNTRPSLLHRFSSMFSHT